MELENLMREWNCLDILPTLKANLITVNRLNYLAEQDIKELIPLVGPRAEFREKLLKWKENGKRIEEPTPSTVKVKTDMINADESISRHTINISKLFENNFRAKTIKKYFQEHNYLLDDHRNDIIKVILEAVFEKDVQLNCFDFAKITDQIVEAFPTESKGYYFIPRGKRKNPGGKLYDKYHNMKNKRRKLENAATTADTSSEQSPDFIKVEEFDWNIEIKSLLQEDISASFCTEHGVLSAADKWKDTYVMRRTEVENIADLCEFLNQWPAFKQPNGYVLIKYDFNKLHPGKENCIHEKWLVFKKHIFGYYDTHIKDRRSREQFSTCPLIVNKDSSNYITLKLLNSVLVPTARYKNSEGRATRKYTISDGEECFTLHLTSLDDFKTKYEEFKEKYFDDSGSLQPSIVVVGADVFDLKEFYVHFHGEFFKFPTYLESVNVCFQIFQICNLAYPRAVQNVWMFIQKYFFNIVTKYDVLSPSLAVLLNFSQNAVAK